MPTRGKDLYLLAKQTAAAESIQSVQGGNTTSDDRQINWHETRKSGGILVSATFQRFHPISTLVCLDCCLIKIVDVFGDLATWMEGKVFHAALRVVGLHQNRRLHRLWILMRRAIIISERYYCHVKDPLSVCHRREKIMFSDRASRNPMAHRHLPQGQSRRYAPTRYWPRKLQQHRAQNVLIPSLSTELQFHPL